MKNTKMVNINGVKYSDSELYIIALKEYLAISLRLVNLSSVGPATEAQRKDLHDEKKISDFFMGIFKSNEGEQAIWQEMRKILLGRNDDNSMTGALYESLIEQANAAWREHGIRTPSQLYSEFLRKQREEKSRKSSLLDALNLDSYDDPGN